MGLHNLLRDIYLQALYSIKWIDPIIKRGKKKKKKI